jgi:hypothetical protein
MTAVQTGHGYARELELRAAEHPDERGEILLEAAHQWRHAGDPTRATWLLEQVCAEGGPDAEYARASLADLCFERGDEQEGCAHIAALEESGANDAGPAGLVAELLEERGEYAAAHRWFDIAISRLEADELAAMGKGGYPSLNASLLVGRQRCRQMLGLPTDDWDRMAEAEERHRLDFVHRLERYAAIDRGPRDIRVLVWQQDQQRLAADRWPELFTADVLGHHAEVENRLREMAAVHPTGRFELVRGDVDEFSAYLERTGQDPLEEPTRLSYSNEAHNRGLVLTWPPERNKPCWCGSHRKYKKCCGAPQPNPTPAG